MKHFDIALFEPDSGFASRLGYSKVYCIGKDVALGQRPAKSQIPLIVRGSDQGILANALRDGGVIGIIFEGKADKKVIERVAELGKTVFMPVDKLLNSHLSSRDQALGGLRKTAFACAKLKANASVISLAEDREHMVSAGQMSEIANLILKSGDKRLFRWMKI